MKTGIYVPIPHVTVNSPVLAAATRAAQLPLPVGQTDPGFALALDATLEAERLGFDLALFAERHLGPDLEAWILAAAVASHTSTIRIMPASNPDFWHPNLLAKLAVTLDRIAPGRSAINFVTGWNVDEATHFGSVRHESDDARYARAEAFIATMRGTWNSTPGVIPIAADAAGFDSVNLPLVPADAPPPIYAVSRSDRGREMVARSADYWFADYGSGFARPFEDVLAMFRASVADMRGRAARHEREVGMCVSAFVLPAESESAGWAHAENLRAQASASTPHLVMAQLGALSAGLVGPPDLIRDRIARFADVGVELLLCKYVPGTGALDELADIVMPVSVAS